MPGAPSESPQRGKQLVWFVTGTSSGLGLRLVHRILSYPASASSSSVSNPSGNQDRVIATSRPRSIHLLDPLLSNPAYKGRLKVLPLDIADSEETIWEVVREAVGVWGRIDVCVNNAGSGAASTLEEGGLPFLLRCYETNVFGPVKVTNATVPYMRSGSGSGSGLDGKRRGKGGTILFVGSRSAWKTGAPLTGPYCSAKAALHALVDTYATELAPFNIKVFGIQPGGLRTNTIRLQGYEESLRDCGSLVGMNGANGSCDVEVGNATLPESLVKQEVRLQQQRQQPHQPTPTLSPHLFFPSHPSYCPPPDNPTAYKEVNELVEGLFAKRAGNEPGDPGRGAGVLVDLVRETGPFAPTTPNTDIRPRWLSLGSDCVADIREKCQNTLEVLDKWEEVSRSTGFSQEYVGK